MKKRKSDHRRASSWKLPPVYKQRYAKDGIWTRQSGEPRISMLTRHANDNTLTCSVDNECCDCGLRHMNVYNVMRGPNGQWYLLNRVYRIDGTGKPKEKRK